MNLGARHADGCNLATGENDDLQDMANANLTTGQRIAVDFSAASSGNGIESLLRSLMESEEFRRDSNIIEVPEHGEFAVSDLFVNFSDVTDDHIGVFHGYWGYIPDAAKLRWDKRLLFLLHSDRISQSINYDRKLTMRADYVVKHYYSAIVQ
jgi:hypothetical protein